jgi:hypothetical protein
MVVVLFAFLLFLTPRAELWQQTAIYNHESTDEEVEERKRPG